MDTLNHIQANPALHGPVGVLLYALSLLVCHLIADWFIQTEYQAMNKAKGGLFNRALWTHCLNYTLLFVPPIIVFNENLYWLIFILGTHLFFDRRSPILWIRQHIARSNLDTIGKTLWITIVMDQAVHFFVLVVLVFAKAFTEGSRL